MQHLVESHSLNHIVNLIEDPRKTADDGAAETLFLGDSKNLQRGLTMIIPIR